MGDQGIADRRQEFCDRHGVSGVPAYFGSDSGGYQQDGVELVGVFQSPGFEPEDGFRRWPVLESSQDADLAGVVVLGLVVHRQAHWDVSRLGLAGDD